VIYLFEGFYYVPPHLEVMVGLINGNFETKEIATIVSKDTPPAYYIRLSKNYNVLPLIILDREVSIKHLYQKLIVLWKCVKFYWNSEVVQLRLPSYPALIAGCLSSVVKKDIISSLHGDLARIIALRSKGSLKSRLKSKIINLIIRKATTNSKTTFIMGSKHARLVNGRFQLAANFLIPKEEILKTKLKGAPIKTGCKLKILYVGSLSENKGTIDLIEVVKELYNRNLFQVELHIAGICKTRDIEKALRELSNLEILKFHGMLPWGEALFELYRSCSVLLFPSYSEGTPKVPMEAMAFGIPVISTRCGSEDYIKSQINGILVNVGDRKGMIDAMITLANQPELQRQIIRNGLNTALGNSVEVMKNVFSNEIQSVLS
jgi:glycosyltransferase involved in cell wall biosynthesis